MPAREKLLQRSRCRSRVSRISFTFLYFIVTLNENFLFYDSFVRSVVDAMVIKSSRKARKKGETIDMQRRRGKELKTENVLYSMPLQASYRLSLFPLHPFPSSIVISWKDLKTAERFASWNSSNFIHAACDFSVIANLQQCNRVSYRNRSEREHETQTAISMSVTDELNKRNPSSMNSHHSLQVVCLVLQVEGWPSKLLKSPEVSTFQQINSSSSLVCKRRKK